MNQHTNITKRGASPPQGVKRRRISARVSQALDLIATQGMSLTKIAETVQMDRTALWKALQKENVQAELEQRKARYITAQTAMKGTLKARALEVAADLMENASSEAVRARMVEFLAGESKSGPSVSVTVNNGGGYEFAPPGARIVEIEASATDTQSSGQDDETPAIAGPSDDCEE